MGWLEETHSTGKENCKDEEVVKKGKDDKHITTISVKVLNHKVMQCYAEFIQYVRFPIYNFLTRD